MTRKKLLKRLNKRQVSACLQENHCSLDPLLKSQTPEDLSFSFNELYRCTNENILAVSRDGTGNLYDSVQDWQAELEELIALGKREPVHLLYNQIPQRERFIQEIPVLISNLAKALQLNPAELNKTLESLSIVDRESEWTRLSRQQSPKSSENIRLFNCLCWRSC